MKLEFNKNFFKENKLKSIIFFLLIGMVILSIVFSIIEKRIEADIPRNQNIDYSEKQIIGSEVIEKYSSEDIKTTKKISKNFIEAIYTFNGEKPKESIEKASFLCSEIFKQELENESKNLRPTEDFYYRTVDNLELIQSGVTDKENELLWEVRVTGTIRNRNGDITSESKDESIYLVKLIKEDNSFKVAEYIFNP